MSRVERIRRWYRDKLKRLRQAFEKGKAEAKRERDKRIEDARSKGPTVMYDSIDVSRIPSDAEAVAGYVNGRWATWEEVKRRFPKAKKLSIAVTSSADADCLDIEPGNATPSDAPGWVKRQIARGVKRPVVYANRSQMPAVLTVLERAGFERDDYRVWTAHYGQGKHLCSDSCYSTKLGTEADATQWVEDKSRNLDINLLKPSFFE